MPTPTWVGEWRPHQPRGPIGAYFKSPGPKYALPGSTGHTNHDQRKHKNPAYSFGTRHATFTNSCSPGPAYLIEPAITRVGREGAPKYSLHDRTKGVAPYRNPGPGTYSPEKSGRSAHFSAPCYSLASRTKALSSVRSPGPAAYGLESKFGKKDHSLQYSMTARRAGLAKYKTPGPGTYRVINPVVYKDRGPLYSMTGRNQMPGDNSQKPGPGAHSPERCTVHRPAPPSHSFGIRHSDYLALCRSVQDNDF